MSFGIKVTNDNQRTILSDSTITPMFRGKATLSSAGQLSSGVWQSEFRISFPENIIPFVGANDGQWFTPSLVFRPSADVWAVQIMSLDNPGTIGLSVYAFSPIPAGTPVPNSGFGAVIRKADGSLAYSSTIDSLAPVKAIPTATPAMQMITHESGVIPPQFSGGGAYRLPAWHGSGSQPAYTNVSSSFVAAGLPIGTKCATNWFASDVGLVQFGMWNTQMRVDFYHDYWSPWCRCSGGMFSINWLIIDRAYVGSAQIASQIQQTGWQPTPTNDDFTLFINCAHYD